MRDHLLAAIPRLRAFAYSLTHNRALADDLVQDTLIRAWASRDRFEPGTNFGAWEFTILRNRFYALHRQGWREIEDVEGQYASHLISRLNREPTSTSRTSRGL
jgi:RNA polymerase sigma-70 factor (ECF subfamily)